MDNKQHSVSLGTVVGLGLVAIGVLNLFASLKYHETNLNTSGRLPGVLLIVSGLVVLAVRAIRKIREK
jgi:uncharacterized membrane protein HdeD (DUF308 family)